MGEKNAPEGDSAGRPRANEPSRAPQNRKMSAQTSHGADVAPAGPPNSSSQTQFIIDHAYFEQIIENAAEGISVVDEEHRVLRVNAEFTRIFGYSGSEVSGKPIDKLVVPPDRYAETAWIAQNVKSGK